MANALFNQIKEINFNFLFDISEEDFCEKAPRYEVPNWIHRMLDEASQFTDVRFHGVSTGGNTGAQVGYPFDHALSAEATLDMPLSQMPTMHFQRYQTTDSIAEGMRDFFSQWGIFVTQINVLMEDGSYLNQKVDWSQIDW